MATYRYVQAKENWIKVERWLTDVLEEFYSLLREKAGVVTRKKMELHQG